MSRTAKPGPRPELEAWARSALSALTDLPGVHRAGLALTEGGGRRLLFTAGDRRTQEVMDWCEVDAYEDVPLNNTVRTGKQIVGSLDDLSARYPDFVRRQGSQMRAVASVPVATAGLVLGGFVLYFEAPQLFDERQLGHLTVLGRHLGEQLQAVWHGRTVPSYAPTTETVSEGSLAASHAVAADPRAVALARQFVRDTLRDWQVDPDTMNTAVLCVSELVTNAIIHTNAGCVVRLTLRDGVLVARVRDAGATATRPNAAFDDPGAVRGRGLQLVDALSARWGSELDVHGMTVWCELDVA